MTGWSDGQIWLIIVALGIGTFAIRFSFLGLVGDPQLPDWLLRHLRYTPVAILPALVVPLVLWPARDGGPIDLLRLSAAIATVTAGYLTKSPLWAIVAGMGSYLLLKAVFG